VSITALAALHAAWPPGRLDLGAGAQRHLARLATTAPGTAVRTTTAIEQRLRLVLEVAEQVLEAHPNRSTHRLF
jgi:hypothetical protein